ncbi:MAG: hypothetical protein ACOCQU_01690 [Halolamina sp.]
MVGADAVPDRRREQRAAGFGDALADRLRHVAVDAQRQVVAVLLGAADGEQEVRVSSRAASISGHVSSATR